MLYEWVFIELFEVGLIEAFSDTNRYWSRWTLTGMTVSIFYTWKFMGCDVDVKLRSVITRA